MFRIVSLLLTVATVAWAGAANAACITIYDASTPPDCALLQPSAEWSAPTPPGELLLFKNFWGKGKASAGKPFEGPKKAGIGLAGPVCWTGAPPILSLETVSPDDGSGSPWTPPAATEWQGVVRGGFCQVCCTSSF
jgi:hypothetical protein